MRKLGQHFLKNQKKLKKIVSLLKRKNFNGEIIEIGGGHGELTKHLLKELPQSKIIVLEKDKKLFKKLKEKFSDFKNIEILNEDVLKILNEITKNLKNYQIVGNLPFYITGHFLKILSELENKPLNIIITLQKEVGERLCKKPPFMNLLAASIQFWAEVKIIDFINQKDFWPPPKIKAVILKIKPKKVKNPEIKQNYYRLIKVVFKQPRKTILNNLKTLLKDKKTLVELLNKLKINPLNRPQTLSLTTLQKLTKLLYNHFNEKE